MCGGELLRADRQRVPAASVPRRLWFGLFWRAPYNRAVEFRGLSGYSDRLSGAIEVIRNLAATVRDLAGAAALFLLPWWWHHIVVARPVSGIQHHEFTDISLYVSEALLVVAVIAWLITRPGPLRLPGWLAWPLLAMPVLGLLLVPQATDPLLAFYHAVRLGLVTLWTLLLASTTRLRRWAPGILLAAGSLQAFIALGQAAMQRDLGLQLFGEVPVSPTMSGVSILSYAGTRWLRPYGLTQHPNILAGTLAVSLLLGLGHLSCGRVRHRGLWIVGIGLTTMGLALTFSRAAWLGAAAGALVIGLSAATRLSSFERRRLLLRLGLPVVALAVLFVLLAWPLFASRLGLTMANSEVRSVDERSVMLHIAVRHLTAQPWPGIGLGQFSRLALAEGRDLLGYYPPQPVHVVPILATVELGPLGGLLWLWLALAPMGALIIRRRLPPDVRGPSAAWLALLVIGLFDFYPFQATQGRLLTWTVLALWGAAWMADGISSEQEESHV